MTSVSGRDAPNQVRREIASPREGDGRETHRERYRERERERERGRERETERVCVW